MWQHDGSRGAELRGNKRFALPTATPHYAPDRPAVVEHLCLEIWLDQAQKTIRGSVRLSLRALGPARFLVLDAAELSIESVKDESGEVPFRLESGLLQIDRALSIEERATLIIRYSGTPRRGLYFIGPSDFDDARPPEVWTQNQDDDAKHWFPCFDHPQQKARTEMIIHSPKGLFALSNGELVERLEVGDEIVHHYRQEVPHSTYLVTLVVGEYEAIQDSSGPVPVVSYVHPRDLERGRRTFRRTAEMIGLFSDLIGVPYPFPRYAQICVADFIFGGMENTSATSLTENILFDEAQETDFRGLSESLIAHELAHQWWGDLVTCTDWSHAWLNEGFATYFETLWRGHTEGKDSGAYGRLIDQQAYLAEAYRRPLVERVYEEPIDLFDRHLYEKGGCVLHMLRALMGDARFFKGLRHYCEQHREGSVESSDLRRALEKTSGLSLERFFDEWVFSPGHPIFAIRGRYDPDGFYELTVEQTQRGERVPSVFHARVEVELAFADPKDPKNPERHTRHTLQLELRKQTFRLPAPQRPRYVVFDRGGHLLKQVDLQLPPSMLRALLRSSSDPLAAIDAARKLVRSGEPESIRAVAVALAQHPFYGVRAEAAKALAQSLTEVAREALLTAMRADPDSRVRRAATKALAAWVGHDEANAITDALIQHAQDERSEYAQADLVRTVAKLRCAVARAFTERSQHLRGHNHCIRAAAAEAWSHLRTLDAIEPLEALLRSDQHNRVREAACTGLGKLGAIAPEHGPERLRLKETLERLLLDPWLRVRMRAAEALKSLGEPSSAIALRRQADREMDGRARRAMRLAAQAIQQRGASGEAVDQLSNQVSVLKKEQTKLLDRLDRLEAKAKPPKKRKKKKKKS